MKVKATVETEAKRQFAFGANIDNPDYSNDPIEQPVVEEQFANLVTSKLDAGLDMHAPALDLDVPARLVPSSTPGHSHLYIDVPMPWDDYVRLLTVLADVGILEPNYVSVSIARGASYLRKEGVYKPGSDAWQRLFQTSCGPVQGMVNPPSRVRSVNDQLGW